MIEKIRELRCLTLAIRQVAVPVAVAVVLSMLAFGCNGRDGETGLSPTGGFTFNSKLSLVVFARYDDGRYEEIGWTPSVKPVVIPKCESWSVKPWFVKSVCPVDIPALSKEVASKGIPGLILRGASDEDMVHLKGLTGLKELGLSKTLVTDEGLAHLKGLKELRRLDMMWISITDVGLPRTGSVSA